MLSTKNKIKTFTDRGGLTIRAMGQCPVVHSDKQHINKQWIELIADRNPRPF